MLHVPLAQRMRPQHIDDIVGQSHLVGNNKPIRKMIELKQVRSIILSGPPGTGKTSIAEVIANTTDLEFRKLNAVSAKKSDIDKVIKEARDLNTSIILYVSEIHRFSKTQVESLLGVLEEGFIILVGSTTESPYHAVPPAIISRSTVFNVSPLNTEDIIAGLERAINDKDNGLGKYKIKYERDVLEFIAHSNNGDLRSSLNTLENAFIFYSYKNVLELDSEMIKEITGKRYVNTEGSTTIFNLLSAFQKSIRGSDVNASLYYLGQLLELGALEEVCRRIPIIAYEDIGLAHLNIGIHAKTAVDVALSVGLAEAFHSLSVIVVELCLSPKSNSAHIAYKRVIEDLKNGNSYQPPLHLHDGHYKGAPQETNSYKYPHDDKYRDQVIGGWADQKYLPTEMKYRRYFSPNSIGNEQNLKNMYDYISEKNK